MTSQEKILSALKKDRRYKFRELKSIAKTTNASLDAIIFGFGFRFYFEFLTFVF